MDSCSSRYEEQVNYRLQKLKKNISKIPVFYGWIANMKNKLGMFYRRLFACITNQLKELKRRKFSIFSERKRCIYRLILFTYCLRAIFCWWTVDCIDRVTDPPGMYNRSGNCLLRPRDRHSAASGAVATWNSHVEPASRQARTGAGTIGRQAGTRGNIVRCIVLAPSVSRKPMVDIWEAARTAENRRRRTTQTVRFVDRVTVPSMAGRPGLQQQESFVWSRSACPYGRTCTRLSCRAIHQYFISLSGTYISADGRTSESTSGRQWRLSILRTQICIIKTKTTTAFRRELQASSSPAPLRSTGV